jgi:protein-S-isoprenylcysteine O-methyltransferase Ste14
MNEATGNFRDRSGAVVRPPIAWALAAIAGLALDWLYPMPFLPVAVPAGWLGGIVFLAGLVLLIWAAATFRRAGTQIPTTQPTTTIVDEGPTASRATQSMSACSSASSALPSPSIACGSSSYWCRSIRHPLRRGRPRGGLSRAQAR